jgi:hypothetical protein
MSLRPATPEIHIPTISIPLSQALLVCTELQELHLAGPHPHRPAQPCMISSLLATPPRPATPELGSPSLYRPAQSLWVMPLRPAQVCMISALPGHAPKACHTKDTHMCNLRSPGLCHPGSSSQRSKTCKMYTPPACALQVCQARTPKARYFTSAKGLHP